MKTLTILSAAALLFTATSVNAAENLDEHGYFTSDIYAQSETSLNQLAPAAGGIAAKPENLDEHGYFTSDIYAQSDTDLNQLAPAAGGIVTTSASASENMDEHGFFSY